jgi:hypothetical protein
MRKKQITKLATKRAEKAAARAIVDDQRAGTSSLEKEVRMDTRNQTSLPPIEQPDVHIKRAVGEHVGGLIVQNAILNTSKQQLEAAVMDLREQLGMVQRQAEAAVKEREAVIEGLKAELTSLRSSINGGAGAHAAQQA